MFLLLRKPAQMWGKRKGTVEIFNTVSSRYPATLLTVVCHQVLVKREGEDSFDVNLAGGRGKREQ